VEFFWTLSQHLSEARRAPLASQRGTVNDCSVRFISQRVYRSVTNTPCCNQAIQPSRYTCMHTYGGFGCHHSRLTAYLHVYKVGCALRLGMRPVLRASSDIERKCILEDGPAMKCSSPGHDRNCRFSKFGRLCFICNVLAKR
jgi:hypothetical protein